MHTLRLDKFPLWMLLVSCGILFRNALLVCGVNNAFRFHNPHGHNLVVQGVSHKSVYKRSAMECGLACEDDPDCVSFNFGKKDRRCELNSQRMNEIGETPKDGYRYYELPRDGK